MIKIISIILLISLSGCIDNYPVKLPFDEPRLVVDVLISSIQEESFITIGWSYPAGTDPKVNLASFLHPLSNNPQPSNGGIKVTGSATITEIESMTQYTMPIEMQERSGQIRSYTNMAGSPGFHYSLNVTINYDGVTTTYQSFVMMRKTPTIDNIDYVIRTGDNGKENNYVPLVSFTEPKDSKDYYLFKLCDTYGSCNNSRAWPFSVIRDTFLPEHVNGLSIDDGASVAKYAQFYPQDGAIVKMYSVDETTYLFYKALIEQFNNDGGAYSPSPATPNGNISNGAIGLFRALDESSGTIYY